MEKSMKLQDEIDRQYRELIDADPDNNRKGAFALQANTERSALFLKGDRMVRTLQVPKIFTQDTICEFERIVKTANSIFEKVIREYRNSEEYRRLFPFSSELERLILLPSGYDSVLPIARFDIFYHEDTGEFYFCEINTDGTSAMNEDRILGELMIDNPAHQEMIRRYELSQFELFDSWVNTFLDIYDTYEKKVAHPNVAIVDFLDMGTVKEFQEFARRFQKAGVNCEICDIRRLRYENGVLLSENGHKIDAIYRRAVTSDIMKYYDQVQPFIRAVEEQKVFLAGSFCTQIIHNKWLFYVLRLDRTKCFLTKEEQEFVEAHVPETVLFAPEYIGLDEVIAHKDRYILKPLDSYACKGVYAGVDYDREQWEAYAREVYQTDYICQHYCPQYRTENIDFVLGDGQWHPYINMTGLYVYNGKFAGIYSRLAEGGGIISSQINERAVPTYFLKSI